MHSDHTHASMHTYVSACDPPSGVPPALEPPPPHSDRAWLQLHVRRLKAVSHAASGKKALQASQTLHDTGSDSCMVTLFHCPLSCVLASLLWCLVGVVRCRLDAVRHLTG